VLRRDVFLLILSPPSRKPFFSPRGPPGRVLSHRFSDFYRGHGFVSLLLGKGGLPRPRTAFFFSLRSELSPSPFFVRRIRLWGYWPFFPHSAAPPCAQFRSFCERSWVRLFPFPVPQDRPFSLPPAGGFLFLNTLRRNSILFSMPERPSPPRCEPPPCQFDFSSTFQQFLLDTVLGLFFPNHIFTVS